jgi:hypothetical protein
MADVSPFGDSVDLATERYKLEYANRNNNVMFPEYATGARSIIYINDQRIAAALDVSYSVNIEGSEIRTIDAQLPWELVPGQISIEASLRRIVHPSVTMTSEHLFTIITAALHTPYASLKIQDKLGNLLFFAKGSFTSLQGQVAVGQTNIESVRFQGYYWRQNDAQLFIPEPPDGPAGVLKRMGQAKLGALKAIGAAAGF